MKTRYAIKILAGAILAAIGILLPFLIEGIETLSTVLVTIGFVTIAVACVRHWRLKDELESDERTKKLGAYGLSYSWLLTLVFLAVLFWIDYLKVLTLPLSGVLFVTILLMALSARLFQWYLFRQGDVV